MIPYLVFGLLFILLVVFTVLARKAWHWSNIVAVILLFIANTVALFMATRVLDLRSAEIKEAYDSEIAADRAEGAADLARFGPADSFTYGPGSLRDTENKLALELIGQGRVWKHGSVEQRDGNFVFKFARAREQMTEADKLQGVMLYVFSDAQADGLPPYPDTFLGTFRVKEETPDTLTLAPEFLVSQEAVSRPASWTLFEKMPIDRDSAFREANGITQAELATLNDFRAKLVNDVFPASLFGLNPDSKEYEELIDKVLFDGMTKGDIETYIRENQATRKSNRFEPSPEEEFVLYRFEDKSKRSYVVDATGTPDLTGDFSPSGQANNQSLHYGKEATFQKGDVVMIDKLTADGYQRADQTQVPPFAQEEPVTEISRIYKRKLADFPRQLEAYRREAVDFAKRTGEIKIENDKTQKALDATQTQEQSRDEVISMLQQDRDNLKSDAELISKLLQERNSQVETLKTQLETLRKELDAMKQKVGASFQLPNQPGRVAGR